MKFVITIQKPKNSRKPIAARFQHITATHATDIGDFVTTVTQRITVAQSNYNFEPSIVSAIAKNLLLHVFSTKLPHTQ